MHPPGAATVLVRYGGDIHTKSAAVRHRMEERLAENVAAHLDARGLDGEVETRWSRPRVHTTESQVEAVADAAAEAFGVVSTSPVLRVDSARAAIEDALARTAREHYDGGTFAVDARRATDDLPFTSEDAERFGGTAVWEAVEGEFDPEVDLDDPDRTFAVEIREEGTFVSVDAVEGPGGLPLGSQGRLVALVSGGIDSPVAAYEVMRRGSPVVPVYLDLGDYGGPDHRARALESVRTLAGYAPNFETPTYVVPAGEVAADLAETVQKGRMLVFRRFMYRVAELVAEREGAHGIVTGEAVGQKSSQTAENLGATSRATALPVHRPLLTADKQDVVERAKEVGTRSSASVPAGCNRFAPRKVETRGRMDLLRDVEPDDLFDRAEAAVEAAEVVRPDPSEVTSRS
ncbi:MAG: tRNA sulfurtransferase [Halobacteriaceae archaeon]